MKSIVSKFSKEDRDRIVAAVVDAEGKTSGEIVPFIVEQSDIYEDAEWRGAVLCSIIVFCLLVALREWTTIWLPLEITTIGLATLTSGAVGFLLVRFVPFLKVAFAGKHLIEHRVAQRAAEAFIHEEVFRTRDRTGILLFVSLLEHRVLVVGDSGINAKVSQADWHDIVQRVIRGTQDGKIIDGLVDAIGQCGNLLERHGLKRRKDDRDEISDSLRVSDR